jgi:hypothetical protein
MRTPRWAMWGMWAVFVAGMAACLTVAWCASTLAAYSWSQVVDYQSPYLADAASRRLVSVGPAPGPALVHRVVLVIVDGLREDVSRASMPGLSTLRTYGSDLTLTVPQPSLSFPNWTTILTGASPGVSGVTTNWHTGRELAPTIIDMARASGDQVIVVGPTDFTKLFGIVPGSGVSLRQWPEGGYLTSQLVDDALRLSKAEDAELIVLHLPDLDEAGHESGGASARYRSIAAKIDADLSRLVAGLQGEGTAFIITADHGHIDSGGHGGWEPTVLHVPGVFAGSGVRLGRGVGDLQQIAPTVSVLLGIRDPAFAQGQALRSVVATSGVAVFGSDVAHHIAFDAHYVGVVSGADPSREQLLGPDAADATAQRARDGRLSAERNGRVIVSLAITLAAICVIALMGVASWRALVAALAGAVVYYAVYETLFFLVHHYQWSLSAFNTETYVKTFMAWRMVEAGFSALLGVAVAAAVYPLLRRAPKGPQLAQYLPGHLTLGPATLLVVLGTLGVQVAWYLWWWGASITWTLPDLRAGFKYDLDLVQMTAIGFTVVLAPLVTYLIGRYHPRVHRGGG